MITPLLPLLALCASLTLGHTPTQDALEPAVTWCTDSQPANSTCTDRVWIDSLSRWRTFLVSFPGTYKAGGETLYPVIMSFHGRGKSAAEQQLLTGFSLNSVNNETIAVYPQGIKDEWQGDPTATTDDVGFVSQIIDHLKASSYSVNPSKIYATGKSNGGGLVNILACDAHLSANIAAFAAVSGAFYQNGTGTPSPLILPPCQPSNKKRTIPFMEFHGTSDCTINYNGGSNTRGTATTRSVFGVVLDWAKQENCTWNAPQTVGTCKIQRWTWTCNGVVDTVVHYIIPSLMHDWPNINGNDDCPDPGVEHPDCLKGYCNTCIEASPIIKDWLLQFELPDAGTPPAEKFEL